MGHDYIKNPKDRKKNTFSREFKFEKNFEKLKTIEVQLKRTLYQKACGNWNW